MDSELLKPWQAARIGDALFPHLNYLYRLHRRMVQVGFVPDDRLFQLVTQAYDALHALNVELHYLSCSSGVGRSSGKK